MFAQFLHVHASLCLPLSFPLVFGQRGKNNDNNREFIEPFQRPKVFYSLKKDTECINTHKSVV